MGNKMLEGRLMYEGLAKSNFAVLKHMVVSDIILVFYVLYVLCTLSLGRFKRHFFSNGLYMVVGYFMF